MQSKLIYLLNNQITSVKNDQINPITGKKIKRTLPNYLTLIILFISLLIVKNSRKSKNEIQSYLYQPDDQ